MSVPTKITDAELLRQNAHEGLKQRNLHNQKEYRERLEYELEVVISLGFEAYFLIVQDVVQWASQHMTVGPARGSVGGCLLAYSLGITQIDPLKHNLYFERFLNPARGSLIDIQSISEKLSSEFTKEQTKVNLLSVCLKNRLDSNSIEKVKEEERQLKLKGSEFIGQIIASKEANLKVENSINSWVLYCTGVSDQKPTGELKRSHGSPPDIDCDFSNKDAVYEYVKNKYGKVYVAKVGTWGLLKTKSAIRDVCRILEKPIPFADEIAKLVPPPRHGLWISFEEDAKISPDLLSPKYEEIINPVGKMCGLLRSYGTHAGGIVISPVPINQVVPLHKDKDGEPVTQFDWRTVENIGLLKLDFLGLSTLEIIEETLNLLKKRGIDLDLSSLEDGDKETYELINSGNLDGVFQLSDSGAPVTVAFKPQNIDEISIVNATNRPGPMSSGLASTLLARRNNQEPVTYLHPLLEPILKDTYGVCLFQESVMKIFTDLAGYSMAAADGMRKVMGKKLLGELEKQRSRFTKGCGENGINETTADAIFKTIENSATYLFNRSHSCAYSYLSYYTAYLKTHYPREFYCALLTHENDPDQKIRFASSMKRMNITILPPDVNSSDLNYTPVEGGIRFGLSHIKGVNSKTVAAILDEREKGAYESTKDLARRVKVDKKTAQGLALSGALSSLETELNERESCQHIEDWIAYWKDWDAAKYKEKRIKLREKENIERIKNKKKPLKELAEPKFPKPPGIPNVAYSGREAIALQREMLNMYISGHPLDEIKERGDIAKIKDLWMLQEGDFCTVRGVLLSVKQMSTKKKEMMAMIRIEDRTKSMEALVFPKTYSKYKSLLNEGSILEVAGTVKKQASFSDESFGQESDIVKMFSQRIEEIKPPSERSNWAIICPLLKGRMKIEGGNNVSKSFVESVLGVRFS